MLAVNKTNNLDTTSTSMNKKSANTNGSNNNNNNGIYASKKAATSSNGVNNNNNNNNNSIKAKDLDENSCIDSDSLKHPVGLEAIKEMARNRNLEIQR